MHYNLDFIISGQPFPPERSASRQAKYKQNKKLYDGKMEEVYKLFAELKRYDYINNTRYAMNVNYHKPLAIMWRDLVVGEPPSISSAKIPGDENEELNEQLDEQVEGYVETNNLTGLLGESIIDSVRYGTSVMKVRRTEDNRVLIEPVNIFTWYPVADPDNVKDITAHVLAWKIEHKDNRKGFIRTRSKPVEYVRVEIHTRGQIENKLFEYKSGRLGNELPLNTLDNYKGLLPITKTGVDDFLVIPTSIDPTTDNYFGTDSYTELDDLLQRKVIILTQISRILDRYGDPTPIVDEIHTKQHNGETVVDFKDVFISRQGGQVPGFAHFDGKLENAFQMLEVLDNEIYKISGTSKAIYGDVKAGLATSGSALTRLLIPTLMKADNIKTSYEPSIKKALIIASIIDKEGHELPGVNITWQDGLPDNDLEEAQTQQIYIDSGVVSIRRALRMQGLSGEELETEYLDIIEDRKLLAQSNGNINVSDIGQNV